MARYRVPIEKVEAYRPVYHDSLRLLPDRRPRLAGRSGKTKLKYAAYRYGVVMQDGEPGYGFYDSSNYAIGVNFGNKAVLTFVVTRNRVVDAKFTVTQDLKALRRYVALIQEAGFGEWVKPALENSLRSMAHAPFGTPARLRALRRMIDGL